MSSKIAMAASLTEYQECTSCHRHTGTGYMLRDKSLSRFVCEECYEDLSSEYSLASKVIEIKRSVLKGFFPEGQKFGFHAGYLMGKKETVGNGYKITVVSFIDSIQGNRGTADLFSKDDVHHIRRMSKEQGLAMVGIFRTSPSGVPDFNLLDNKTLEDMLLDIIYMVIGGCSEMQIAIKDKSGDFGEIGVVIV